MSAGHPCEMKNILYLILFIPILGWTQINFDLTYEITDDQLNLDVFLSGDEEIEMGSINFPFTVSGNGVDHENATKVSGLANSVSPVN